MSQGATIDPLQLYIIFGSYRVTGRAKGESVSVSKVEDDFSMEVGVDGIGYWIKNASNAGIVNVSLVPNSVSNLVLSAFLNLDKITPGGLVRPLSITEANGSTILAAPRARIMRRADATWSDGAVVRQWQFGAIDLGGTIGGLEATPLDPG